MKKGVRKAKFKKMKFNTRQILVYFPIAVIYFILTESYSFFSLLLPFYRKIFEFFSCTLQEGSGAALLSCGICRVLLVEDCLGVKEILFVTLFWVGWLGRKKVSRLLAAILIVILVNLLRIVAICLEPALELPLKWAYLAVTVWTAMYSVGFFNSERRKAKKKLKRKKKK